MATSVSIPSMSASRVTRGTSSTFWSDRVTTVKTYTAAESSTTATTIGIIGNRIIDAGRNYRMPAHRVNAAGSARSSQARTSATETSGDWEVSTISPSDEYA